MSDSSAFVPFDFDCWAALAVDDPHRFEEQRRQTVTSAIDAAPETIRPRLHALQWKVDQVRRQAGTPLLACMRISDLMWDRALGAGGLLSAVEHLADPALPFGPGQRDNVVSFRAARRGTKHLS